MSDTGPQKPGKNTTDTGQNSSRLPSIPGSIKEEDETEAESPDTVRQSSSTVRRREYGTLEVPEGTVRSKSFQQRPTSPSGFAQVSPVVNRTQKRPQAARRTSTRRQLPHRGEYFSVDDDPFEVEGDRSENFPTLKRIPSNTRRRTTAQITTLATLPRLESHSGQHVEDENQPSAVESSEPVQDHSESTDDLEDEGFIDEDDDETLSDAESFTLKDRQLAINETHPFGIRIWKPALYKKNRSVEKNAEEDIHSSPSQIVSKWLWVVNFFWTVIFGWWLAAFTALAALFCFLLIFEPSAAEYGKVFWGLSGYLFWPFGKFVKLEQDEQYAEEDEGEGRSISEYERWQSGDLEYGRLMFGPTLGNTGSIVGRNRDSYDSLGEREHLLGRNGPSEQSDINYSTRTKRRLFGRGQWTLGRIIFFGFFYIFIAPLMMLVSLICWLLVFTIPMGRVLLILLHQLRKRPLALSFHPDVKYSRDSTKPSSILLCTYRAAGTKYWKYTIDGTNIFLINFLLVVVLVIVDYFALRRGLGLDNVLTSPALLFILGLVSIIPLAYFIGQAVASISAQSSMGMGAAVNAFFSTLVEVYLYCVALNEGKADLVEGSIIGSIFAGILLLPGLSMCFGAIKRKTQRFNVKSAGATTTMLLFAIIATFGPTLFYKIYGSHELICMTCTDDFTEKKDCRRCYFRQTPAIDDDFFSQAVRPYCWAAAIALFLSYFIGLLFTLRTHASVIWSTDVDEKKQTVPQTAEVSPMDTRLPSAAASQQLTPHHGHKSNVRDSQFYTRLLGQSLRSAGLTGLHDEHVERSAQDGETHVSNHLDKSSLPHLVPPKTPNHESAHRPIIPGLSEEQNTLLVHQVAEVAATAASIAARDVIQQPKATSYHLTHGSKRDSNKSREPSMMRMNGVGDESYHHAGGDASAPTGMAEGHEPSDGHGGHDAPNWSRMKSSIILLTATVAYAAVAEILVDTVDVVLESITIQEKFLGITLFALVPNTTEFLNAISFAMNGNIALSMEIGSAYVLQVCLLQIPALVLFTAVRGRWIDDGNLASHTFNLIFPQWDMITVILCVFLLTHVYGEGKSNYFKGSILVLTYLVVILGFWFSSFTSMDIMGVDPSDTLAIMASGWSHPQNAPSPNGHVVKKSEL